MQAFQVFARVRPLNEREASYGYNKKAVQQQDVNTLTVGEGDGRETYFTLDGVFGEDGCNEDIFQESARPLVDNFLAGINSTIFAYGITGAGKSFTMFGNQANSQPGIIQLVLEYICSYLHEDAGSRLCMSYMQIYNEQVFDLLKHKSETLQILDDPVLGVVVNDLEKVEISSVQSALQCIELGNQRRVIAETKANQFSSRSHAIVQLTLERSIGEDVVSAKFSLVDLAGSEKQSVYGENKGIRNLEGSNINRSLLTLGNCINLLSSKKGGFIPYRDSKLTRLLKDSLGGNTLTAMIACISPSVLTYEETLNTMKYACRARKIEKNVHQNIKDSRTVQQLKREILQLKKEMAILKQGERVMMAKQEMKDILQRLIRNVQILSQLKAGQSSALMDKMREVQLIDQQRAIIGSILSKCADQTPEYPTLMKVDLQHSIKSRFRPQANPVKFAMQIEEQKQQSSDQNVMPLNTTQLDRLKNRPNLQNIRLKCRQQRKNLTELVMNYCQNYHEEQLKQQEMSKAHRYLELSTEFTNTQDWNILQKISKGESLDKFQLAYFNIQPSASQRQLQSDKEVLIDEPPTLSNNRFLSSLQEIRKMMRRITLAPHQEQQSNGLPTLEQNDEEIGLFDSY